MSGQEIEKLAKIIAKLPALGTRSSRRIVLYLLKKRETALLPLIEALQEVAANVKTCEVCGNYDTLSPCSVCCSEKRDGHTVCVVQDVADLWAMERVGFYKGKYHVLGGVLSALDGVSPDDLNVDKLLDRLPKEEIGEVILALPATVDRADNLPLSGQPSERTQRQNHHPGTGHSGRRRAGLHGRRNHSAGH